MPLSPLTGFTIGVAADRRAEEQATLLGHLGARVLHGPTMRTHVDPDAGFGDATRALITDPPEVTVLSTGIGVRAWIDAAEAIGLGHALVEALSRSTVWARGPKALGAAATAGIPVAWQAASGTSAELVAALNEVGVAGRRIAVQLDGAEEPPVLAAIEALDAVVVAVRVYRWALPPDLRPARRLVHAVCEQRVDAVTFTSRPQVENLFAVAAEEGAARDMRDAFSGRVRAVCVGPVCAEAAVAAGVAEPVVPARARLGAMVMAVADTLSATARTVEVDGVTIRVQGHAIDVAGAVVELAARERAVLEVLLERPGAVVSPARLLARVWRGAGDDHAVVVTVARLRRRLVPAGITVDNVFRRGYRVRLRAHSTT